MVDEDTNCAACGEKTEGGRRLRPFGFTVVECPSCKKRTWYPLSKGWRIFWWVIVGLTVIAWLSLLGTGLWGLPGGVSLIAALVLVRDAILRKSARNSTVVTAVITTAAVLTAVGIVLAIGLNNGYTSTVIDRPESTDRVYSGIEFSDGDQICGDNDDFNVCVNMHIAMYNSICVSPELPYSYDLSPFAEAACEGLDEFIDKARDTYAGCGAGCVTIADKDGRWGYSYMVPAAWMKQVTVAEISHQERCWFDLGAFTLGYCPGRD